MRFVKIDGNFISSKHRGDQIAEQLGDDFMQNCKNDTVVFLKTYVPEIAAKYSNAYIDMMDSNVFLYQQDDIAPHVKFIVNSDVAFNYVRWRTDRDIVIIPDSHINFENYVRDCPSEIKTVGYVGNIHRLDADLEDLHTRFAAVGIEFKSLIMETAYYSREYVCDFFKGLDVNISFCKHRNLYNMPPELKSHPKIVHAASFGIPTIAYPEAGFMGANCWEPVRSLNEMVDSAVSLRSDMGGYKMLRARCLAYAKNYHVKTVAEKYKLL